MSKRASGVLELEDRLSDLSRLFKKDEVLTEIDPHWTEEDLLSQDGVFSFSKVIDVLGLDKKKIREFAKSQEEAGVDIYGKYGLKKMEGSQWRIRMKIFREAVDEFKQKFWYEGQEKDIQRVPDGVTRQDFFNLRGKFKLKEVVETGYLPYDMREVTSFLKKEEISREKSGCWKGAKDWYVDFVPFILFLYARFQKLSLEDVKKAFRVEDEPLD